MMSLPRKLPGNKYQNIKSASDDSFGGYPSRDSIVDESKIHIDFYDGVNFNNIKFRDTMVVPSDFCCPESKQSMVSPLSLPHRYQIHDKIEANYQNSNNWYPGEIIKVNINGTFDIQYDDGDTEFNVNQCSIRPSLYYQLSRRTNMFELYDLVESNNIDKLTYISGEVEKINPDGTFDIQYDDGRLDKHVRSEYIRLKGPTNHNNSIRDNFNNYQVTYHIYDLVDGRIDDKDDWYPGEIKKVNKDGTYAIEYDNGVYALTVVPNNIRIRDPLTNNKGLYISHDKLLYKLYDRVECQYKLRNEFFPGEIIRVNNNNTYNIQYDNGAVEYNVRKDLIRPVQICHTKDFNRSDISVDMNKSHSSPIVKQSISKDIEGDNCTYNKGDQIECRFGGSITFFRGTIFNVNSDNTYDVQYLDGFIERNVSPRSMRQIQVIPLGTKVIVHMDGTDRVGNIKSNSYDFYEVAYEDGSTGYNIHKDLIRIE